MTEGPTTEAQAVLDMLGRSDSVSSLASVSGPGELVVAWRQIQSSLTGLQGAVTALHSVTDHQFPGADGSLTMRVYRPADGVLPVLLYFHGGCFVAGSIDSYDVALRNVAHMTNWAVVASEYRLAPEHPYPAAPEDCYAALEHLAAHATSFGVDPTRIVVAGDSAGGLFAACVALMARDRNGPQLAGMACLYPNADLCSTRRHPSMAAHDRKVFSLQHLGHFIDLYLPEGIDRTQPYASPGLAADLTNLPPALILTCECDPIRDEGEAFARRLRDAGVRVEMVRLPGMIHGVVSLMGLLPVGSAGLMANVGDYLRRLPGVRLDDHKISQRRGSRVAGP